MDASQRVLVLGCSGMLGHMLLRQLSQRSHLDVVGASRNIVGPLLSLPDNLSGRIRTGVDADNFDTVIRALASYRPTVVINCIGLVKQHSTSSDPLSAITVNSLLPHRLSLICKTAGARMIHISTDCVYSGARGNYVESDPSDAVDLYGRSKFLGEVAYPHCVTLRTSFIGHELKSHLGLVDWFLSQTERVRGYARAVYSGFTSIELSRVICEHVLDRPDLSGVYHVSADPISKCDLLQLVADTYQVPIPIDRSDDVRIDRSLRSERFRDLTGYRPPSWPTMIADMHRDFLCCTHCYRAAALKG